MIAKHQKVIVVIGNGMVGHRFCEKMIEYDTSKSYRIVTFCEESRAAYDRVGLTSFFAHRDAERLMLARHDWYVDHGISLHIGDRATHIDRKRQIVTSERGVQIDYDYVVLATGSYPFVPAVDGIQQRGVFVYRTIEDLERIIAYGATVRRCGVIGGGLLGLEAAKAALDLGLETHVIEFAPRLMPRQIDQKASEILVRRIEGLGVNVHLNKGTQKVLGNGAVQGIEFTDGSKIDVEMIIVSAGIRPRDEIARQAELAVGERGGVVVNDRLQTSDERVYAIGEVALHQGMIYGLVAPGWDMADAVAAQLCGETRSFSGTDLSTKLKLLGIDVASFGETEGDSTTRFPLVYEDPFSGIYKKLCFNREGTRLLGGILVGDASQYSTLLALSKSTSSLPGSPADLIGMGGASLGLDALGDDAQVCSCNNVSKQTICDSIRTKDLTSVGEVKACTKAGTGCGGCLSLVTDLLHGELKRAGKSVNLNLCEHFAYTRTELFAIVRAKKLRTFDEILAGHGQGDGCEICKPTIASILANLYNEHVLSPEHQTLQDSNDRFLANIQRGGLYSVVPRVPGGEITPDKLIALGETAKQFGLYSKITGAQRVDLFGAQVQDLPQIWSKLVEAGFESGHAYGKALRAVKSCVGTTWCRYGVQNSVAFAIRIENRYKGLRSPHKLKGAVSGCVRECAEAQNKDFGLVATEQGYNLYVCGNGGTTPRHADLLAIDLDEETAIRYIDRFLMYYCMTADRLTRTATWLEKLEGGIDHLRDVIIHDKLGICHELEEMMDQVVDTFRCEWKEVVDRPELQKWFRQFVNTDESVPCIEIVQERGQQRPIDWPREVVPSNSLRMLDGRTLAEHQSDVEADLGRQRFNDVEFSGQADVAHESDASEDVGDSGLDREWTEVGIVDDFPINGGATIKIGESQIAVFRFTSRGEWYACQQMCPHRQSFVLSRGIIGDGDGIPKVACPMHKKTFALDSGTCLSGDSLRVQVFPVRIEGEKVLLYLPPRDVLDRQLGSTSGCHSQAACSVQAAVYEST